MVYMGRRFMDYVKVFQEETLTVIDPFAGTPCLSKCEYGQHEWALYSQLTNVNHSCILLREWTQASRFRMRLSASIQDRRCIVKNSSIAL